MRKLLAYALGVMLSVLVATAEAQSQSPAQAAYSEAVAQHNLANKLFEEKKYTDGNSARAKGISAYERAVAADPRLYEAWVYLGDLLRRNTGLEKDYLRAAEAYQKALAIRPKEADLYNRLNLTYWSIGRNAEAMAAAEQAMRLSPTTPVYTYNLGFQHAELGHMAEARAAQVRLLTLDAAMAKQLLEKIQKLTGESSLIGRPARYVNPKIELVWVKPGGFKMGQAGTLYETGRPVALKKGFYIAKYPVTQAQWRAVMGDNPSFFKTCGDNCPVEQVSWFDAQAFVVRLSALKDGYRYRLPTEAEWEFAYRAGTTTWAYADGDIGWHSGNSGGKTHPVGQRPANAWGLFDMDGLVNEWCQDGYTKTGGLPDGSAVSKGDEPWNRVLRGRSFYAMNSLSSATRRIGARVDEVSRNNGFRVVAEKAGGS